MRIQDGYLFWRDARMEPSMALPFYDSPDFEKIFFGQLTGVRSGLSIGKVINSGNGKTLFEWARAGVIIENKPTR